MNNINWYKYKHKQQNQIESFGIINLNDVCDVQQIVTSEQRALIINFGFPIDLVKTLPHEYYNNGNLKRTVNKIIRVPYSIVIEFEDDIVNILKLLGIEDTYQPILKLSGDSNSPVTNFGNIQFRSENISKDEISEEVKDGTKETQTTNDTYNAIGEQDLVEEEV